MRQLEDYQGWGVKINVREGNKLHEASTERVCMCNESRMLSGGIDECCLVGYLAEDELHLTLHAYLKQNEKQKINNFFL